MEIKMKTKKLLIVSLFLVLIFLISGCIKIDVDQKIKRNGNYDFAMTIDFSGMIEMAEEVGGEEAPGSFGMPTFNITELEEQAKESVPDSIKDKFEIIATETTISYKFTDIDPEVDTQIFNEDDTAEGSPNMSIFNPDNYEFKKEFKFPYMVYTIQSKGYVEAGDGGDDEFGDPLAESDTDLSAIFDVTYTVETFGEIVETNGEKISKNKAEFKLDLSDTNPQMNIVFRDFFLVAFLGELYWLYLLIISAIVVGVIVFLALKKKGALSRMGGIGGSSTSTVLQEQTGAQSTMQQAQPVQQAQPAQPKVQAPVRQQPPQPKAQEPARQQPPQNNQSRNTPP